MLAFYRELLRLRRERAPLAGDDPGRLETTRSDDPPVVWVRRAAGAQEVLVCLHFGEHDAALDVPISGEWRVALDSADARFAGPGAARLEGRRLAARPTSFVLLEGGWDG
jgi:hypothetical protein